VSAIIDERLLERWQTSRRHQDEARRFLARQRFADPEFERHALAEVVGTIEDMELALRERAARRRPRAVGVTSPSKNVQQDVADR
jgi:hypothetical protein